jgi:multicomponent Na+:H+ antiporter subunit D
VSWLLLWPVLVPLLGAAAAVATLERPRTQRAVTVLALALQTLAAWALLARILASGPVALHLGGWPPPFAISLGTDVLGSTLCALAAPLGLVLALPGGTPGHPIRAHRTFAPLLLALLGGVAGVFLTADLFNLYVWFEVALMASFGLLVLGGGRARLDASVTYAMLNLVGTALLLVAIGLVYGRTGSLDMGTLAGPGASDPALLGPALLFFLGLAAKAALFPLGFWLPAAYPNASPVVAALFAGLLTKSAAYALFRTGGLVFSSATETIASGFLALGAATALFGGVGCLAADDARRFAAFTVLGGIGVTVVGLGLDSPLGTAGGLAYLFQSMVATPALFLAAAYLVPGGEGAFRRAGGLWARDRLVACTFGLCVLAVSGVPPLTGFWPKLLLVRAGLEAGAGLAVAAVLAGGFLTLLAGARAFALACWRPSPTEPPETVPLAGGSRWVLASLTALLVVAGLLPEGPGRLARAAADDLRAPAALLEVLAAAPPEGGSR